MNEPARLLIVDDEKEIRLSLRKALAREGLQIEEAGSGEEALQALSRLPCDLVLTDIRMGTMGGLDLLAEIKARWPDVVVILLTGYASVESAVQALRRGAHNYLIKPVSIHEVRAAIREALSKRCETLHRQEILNSLRTGILTLSSSPGEPAPAQQPEAKNPQRLQAGNLVLDKMKHTVTVADEPVALTPIEFCLLLYLLEHPERVVSYQKLVQQLHGYTCSLLEAKRLVMPHVSHLRHKLRARHDLIENVRGIGYILSLPV
jgi:DNA-binding response OmpR family regulator